MTEVEEVRQEYVKQIIEAVRKGEDADYVVTELLKEYGARAYLQGRQHLAELVKKMV